MPNSTVPASATALPITRRFIFCSMVAAPVALAPAGIVPAFDPHAFVAAMRGIGMHLEPCHALRSYFIGQSDGRQFVCTSLEDRDWQEAMYLALCEVRHD